MLRVIPISETGPAAVVTSGGYQAIEGVEYSFQLDFESTVFAIRLLNLETGDGRAVNGRIREDARREEFAR